MDNRVTLEINTGNFFPPPIYEGWQNIRIEKSLENLTGSFSIKMSQKFNSKGTIDDFLIKEGDECTLYVNDKELINGFIDTLEVEYSPTSHSIVVSGRDKTSDIADCSLTGNADLNAPYTAVQLVEHVISIIGADIQVIDNTGLTLNYEEDFDGGAGKNAWQQLDKYLQKKSIFATVNTDGNIVLFRGSFGNTKQSLFNIIQGANDVNNIIEGKRFGSHADRFNTISVLSQSSSLQSNGIFYSQGGDSYSSTDSTIRSSRKLEIVANASLTSTECQNLANFQQNVRQARGTTYIYKIQGFTQNNGDLWLPNYEVSVKDEFFGLNNNFLIQKVIQEKGEKIGSITTLHLVDKLAYTLREPVATKEGGVLFAR